MGVHTPFDLFKTILTTFQTNPSPARQPNRPAQSSTGLIIMAVGILILLMSLVTYFRPSASSGIVPPQLNARMSNFELAGIDGNWISLNDFTGQVVLINTWATWCPPCRAEMPDLNAFYNQYKDEGFVVLALNAGEAPATAADFVSEFGLDFPVVVDPDYRVMDALKINTYPTSIIVDRKGVIRNIRVGVHTPETLAAEVLPLLSEN